MGIPYARRLCQHVNAYARGFRFHRGNAGAAQLRSPSAAFATPRNATARRSGAGGATAGTGTTCTARPRTAASSRRRRGPEGARTIDFQWHARRGGIDVAPHFRTSHWLLDLLPCDRVKIRASSIYKHRARELGKLHAHKSSCVVARGSTPWQTVLIFTVIDLAISILIGSVRFREI